MRLTEGQLLNMLAPLPAEVTPLKLKAGSSTKFGIIWQMFVKFDIFAVELGNAGICFTLVEAYMLLTLVKAAIEPGNAGKYSALKQLLNICEADWTFAAVPKNTGKFFRPLFR